MYMCRYDIISIARMAGTRFYRKTVDAILEEFQILYKKYKVKILKNCVNTFLIIKDYLKD